jgi:hypothetical protein
MIYLAPNNAPDNQKHFGLLVSLNSQREIKPGAIWAMDNGRFSKGGVNLKWTQGKWEAMLKRYQSIPGCKFCVVPDVPFNAAETLELFYEYAPIVKSYGYPLAICTQDTMIPDDIPWSQISAVFIGGSDDHKLGAEAVAIMLEAKRRGVWVHVGRVNTYRLLWKAHDAGAESCDGTGWLRDPSRTKELVTYLEESTAGRYQQRLFA